MVRLFAFQPVVVHRCVSVCLNTCVCVGLEYLQNAYCNSATNEDSELYVPYVFILFLVDRSNSVVRPPIST